MSEEVSSLDPEITVYNDDTIAGEDDGGVEILTRIVTVFSKTVKNRLMSAGLNVTMKHLWPHLNIPKVSDMLTILITDHFTMLISSLQILSCHLRHLDLKHTNNLPS